MTPQARVQAAIEILDQIIISATVDGPAADVIVSRNLKERRYAGSKDRRAVREWVFKAIRSVGDLPKNGRAAMLALGESKKHFDGSPYGPAPWGDHESRAPSGLVPRWLEGEISTQITKQEWPALLERAPLDLRVNAARTDREAMLAAFPDAIPTRLSPWGLRLPPDTKIDDHPAFADGLVEVQDEGSQLIALACVPTGGQRILDLCAGAGGKTLAIAAAAPEAELLATDTNRARLSQLAPRAERAGATIATRLLDPPNELAQLDDWRGSANVVLVDAPCSGSGTWRRNPEGRWRLTPDRLDRLVVSQSRLLDIAAQLVRPGGAIVYAVCSLLSREGAGQIQDFLSRYSSWMTEDDRMEFGRSDGGGRLLTPAHDGTDGFFVARLRQSC